MPREKPEWRLRLDQCDEIMDLLDELPERAEEFATSAMETVQDIAAWIQENRAITPRQCAALDNIQSGAERWSN